MSVFGHLPWRGATATTLLLIACYLGARQSRPLPEHPRVFRHLPPPGTLAHLQDEEASGFIVNGIEYNSMGAGGGDYLTISTQCYDASGMAVPGTEKSYRIPMEQENIRLIGYSQSPKDPSDRQLVSHNPAIEELEYRESERCASHRSR